MFGKKERALRRTTALGAMIAGMAVVGAPAAAQEQPATGEAVSSAEEEIIVTGSRIRRNPETAPAPLIQITQEDLIMSGEPNIIDYLADIPALSASTVPEDTTGANLNDGGLSLLNLRDLGSIRTLVLVDGRRHVGAPQGDLRVDIDTIPSLLIESTEVVTGGQSALYGADAVSGVVNFILKKDFEGVDVDGVVAQINQDGQLNTRFSGLIGETFDDRVNMYLFGEYQHSEEVRDADMDWRRDAWLILNSDTDPGPGTPDDQLDNILIRDARDAFFQRGGVVVISGQGTPSALSDPDIPTNINCASGGSTFLANISGFPNCFPIAPELGRVFVFDENGVARPFNFGTFQDQNGLSRRVNVGGDGLNTGTEFNQGSRVPESTAYRFQTGVNVDITSNVQAFLEAKYVLEETFDEGQPTFFQGGIGAPLAGQTPAIFSTTNFNIGLDNPFLDPALRTAIANNVRPIIDLNPNSPTFRQQTGSIADPRATFNLFGPLRTQFNEREILRFVGGLRGDMDQFGLFKDVSWEVGYTYGETVNENDERGVDVVRFHNALDAVTDTAGLVNGQAGQTVCRVQLLNAQGIPVINPLTEEPYAPDDPIITQCVPQSVFGVDMRQDGFNPAAEAYFNATIAVTHTNVQQDFLAFASGKLWDLWGAGEIGLAAGYEYREEETEGVGRDAGTAGRLLFLNTGPDFAFARYDVTEWFVEGQLPLLRDLPFAEYMEISAAYRTSDYSTLGETETYSVQGQYRPISDLLFRGTYGKAVRVPSLSELFAPPTQTFANNFVDPCDRLVIQNTVDPVLRANRAANCLALNIPAETSLVYPSGIPGNNAGNPFLEPEESRSWTASLVYTPDWLPNASVVFDYYDIEITNVVAAITAQTAANQCVAGPTLNQNACNTIFRNPTTHLVVDFIQGSINYAATLARGIDFSAAYSFELEDLVDRDWGEVSWMIRGNYLIRQQDFVNITNPGFATNNDSNLGLPRVRFLSTLSYAPVDSLRFIWDWDWQASQELFDEDLLINDPDNRSAEFLETGDYSQHDFTVRWDATESVQLRGGVVNAFDADPPPWVAGGGIPAAFAPNIDTFDLFGRRFFLGARFRN